MCRHAHAWGTITIVWDSWLQQTAQAGVYSANEEQFAVPFSQREPVQCQPPSRAPPQQLSTGPALTHVSDAAPRPQGSDIAPQQLQRPAPVTAAVLGKAGSREPAQPAMSGGPPRQSTDSRVHATSTNLQQQAPTYPTESAEATAPARYRQMECRLMNTFLCIRQQPNEYKGFINDPFLVSICRVSLENGSKADGTLSSAHAAQPSTSIQPAHSEGDAFSSGRSLEPGRALAGDHSSSFLSCTF